MTTPRERLLQLCRTSHIGGNQVEVNEVVDAAEAVLAEESDGEARDLLCWCMGELERCAKPPRSGVAQWRGGVIAMRAVVQELHRRFGWGPSPWVDPTDGLPAPEPSDGAREAIEDVHRLTAENAELSGITKHQRQEQVYQIMHAEIRRLRAENAAARTKALEEAIAIVKDKKHWQFVVEAIRAMIDKPAGGAQP